MSWMSAMYLFHKGKKPLRIPQEGRRVKITNLLSCRNAPKGTPNPYIGMEGIVTDLKPDGTFNLVDNSVLVITRPHYEFIYLD